MTRTSSSARLATSPRAGAGLREDRSAAQIADVLPKVAERELPGLFHDAVVGSILAGDQPKHRALAGAVGPDEPDLLARVDLERGIDEQDLAAELLGHLGKRDHAPLIYSTLTAMAGAGADVR